MLCAAVSLLYHVRICISSCIYFVMHRDGLYAVCFMYRRVNGAASEL